ncbi:50S ribosomal protein L13 [Candidatus Liberibacter africanus]|uniref:Large ribosomal subunit protein uL13 n=1 Tax=Candidatus Liberibacter africanus PTSAPSY TaxID=1277257 RepID=A0A0G3I812_LIBAF|nr:50S ribosomal protein L13 [Candidatus Liberibacter africanus]AKK19862.1 50S ribosomal protein L13 [Candidatus Liberibacter africanus PTSAPSY]
MPSFFQKSSEVEKKWVLIDAKGLIVGRLASQIALRLRGKNKPTYTPSVDDGDNVVIINASKVAFSGQKYDKKVYYRHTGYPGGIKKATAREILEGSSPVNVFKKAVSRMLPRGPLARKQMKNLHIYAEDHHPHEAQKPVFVDVAKMNPKNSRRT